MTFNIRRSDGSLLASVQPGTYNNSASSLILFGKNFANYGTAIQENMLHLMEHFASDVPPLNPTFGQLWYDTINQEMKVWENTPPPQWVLLNARSLQAIAEQLVPNRLYVSKSGKDSNSGRSWFSAKKTIRSACEKAATLLDTGAAQQGSLCILVATGDYEEETPLVVPAGVSIVGDNLRSVTVRPVDPTTDVFHLSSATYVFGITVRGHSLNPSALDITPTDAGRNADSSGIAQSRSTPQTGWAFGFAPGSTINVSPYIQNCSSISGDPLTDSGPYPGGGGLLVDPSVCALGGTANRESSIMTDAFTQINLGGIGCKVVGYGSVQLVNFFSNFCQFGVVCVNGGHAALQNSNVSFGNYAFWSEGYRYLDNSAAVNKTWTGDGVTTSFYTNQGTKIYPEQVADLDIQENGVATTRSYSVSDGTNQQSIITFDSAPPGGAIITARIRFPSLIEATSCTLSYAGAGLDYSKLGPEQRGNGRSDPNKYTIALSGGRIYQTTTDERGDFYAGAVTPGTVTNNVQADATPSFRINQRKGQVDGRAFYQSVFGFMTPFVLALTRRGK